MAIDTHGNLLKKDGSYAHISASFFLENILGRGFCFICGISPEDAKFNQEHVIPQWLLSLASIWEEQITLPNGEQLSYGRYKVRCCKDCNTLLGRIFEEPISNAFRGGISKVEALASTEAGFDLLFTWMALLHLKTSIRDFGLEYNVDRRLPQFKIGMTLDAGLLHHVHCLCRAYTNDVPIDDKVFGSMYLFEMAVDEPVDSRFDFVDLHYPQTVLLRVGNIALISCINDSGALRVVAANHFERIKEWGKPLTSIQLKETLAYLSCASLQMSKPRFLTAINPDTDEVAVICQRSDNVEIDDFNPKIMGVIRLHLIRSYLPSMIIDGRQGREAAELVASGVVSFYNESSFDKDFVLSVSREVLLQDVDEIIARNVAELPASVGRAKA